MKNVAQFLTFMVLACAATISYGSPLNSTKFQPRIVNGKEAQRNQFPYMVAIEIVNVYFCGGTILNSRWVVSAARSFHLLTSIKFTVIAGLLDRNEDHPDNQITETDRIVTHPDYLYPGTSKDIALLHLESSLIFNDAVKPIPLLCNQDPSKAEVVTSGWGSTTVPPEELVRLHYLKLSIITVEECKAIFTQHEVTGIEVNNEMLCASPSREDQGSCVNDNGNPLVQNGVLIGVKAGNIIERCGVNSDWIIPNVFTKISTYVDFMEEVTGLDVCDFGSMTTTTLADTESSGTTESTKATTPSSGLKARQDLFLLLVVVASSFKLLWC